VLTRRRPWWKRAVIALLLAATVTVTVVYAMTLATDIARQHWAAALDASREAVLVIVGWAAVAIVLSADRGPAAQSEDGSPAEANSQPPGSDSAETGHPPAEPTPNTESVVAAQWRVHRLRARLSELAAARERAGSGADPDLDREVASTTARLEHARQWLTSAQSALAVRRYERRQMGRPVGGSTHVQVPRPGRQRSGNRSGSLTSLHR